jgi:23S rRNA (guanosine2251-2'-O)-methyltransferase
VAEAVRSGLATAVLVAEDARATDGLRALIREAEESSVPIRRVGRAQLDARMPDHQGVVATIRPLRELDERTLLAMPFDPGALVVVVDGITDPQNLGACARSAEAAGASVLVARRRRAAPVSPAAVRASAGALAHLPLARVPNLPRVLEGLKDRGFTVVGLDHRADVPLHEAGAPPRPLALVVGAEDRGISRLVREGCDLLISIPMRGRVGSLNASAALAVALFGYATRPVRTDR